jgi:hypothetical protein
VTIPKNLLTVQQADFEPSYTGWFGGNTLTSVWAGHGTYSADLTVPAGGNALMGTDGYAPVMAGMQYTAMITIRGAVSGRQIYIAITWRDAAGTIIGATYDWHLVGLTVANTPVPVRDVLIAPAGAVTAQFQLSVNSLGAGEALYADMAGIFAGNVYTWYLPGFEAWVPTTDDILNLNGVLRRADRFKFVLCDRNLDPIGELHPSSESTPSIDNDTSSQSSRRLRGLRLLPSEQAAVNVLTDRLRVYMVLQNGEEFLLGTFLWGDESRPLRSWGEEQHSELVDLSYILNQPTTRVFGWGRGALINLIIYFLIFRAGFKFDDIKVIGSESQRNLQEPLSWQPGARWFDMLTDLGNLVGFAPPWFDRYGLLHFDNAPDPQIAEPTVPDYEAGGRVVRDSIVHTSDLIKAPNEFAVFDSGTSSLKTGRYVIPSSAPHSYANRGYHVGLVESVQGMATQAQANNAAKNLARSKSLAYEWLNFQSTADPRHETYDIVDAFGQRWLETAWSLELKSGGTMSHTLRRVEYEV